MAKAVKITKRRCTIHGWPYDKTKAREGKEYAELERLDKELLPRIEKRLTRTVSAWTKLKQRRARLIKRIERPAEDLETPTPEARAIMADAQQRGILNAAGERNSIPLTELDEYFR